MIDKTILHRLFCRHYSEMSYLAKTLLYYDAEAEDIVRTYLCGSWKATSSQPKTK